MVVRDPSHNSAQIGPQLQMLQNPRHARVVHVSTPLCPPASSRGVRRTRQPDRKQSHAVSQTMLHATGRAFPLSCFGRACKRGFRAKTLERHKKTRFPQRCRHTAACTCNKYLFPLSGAAWRRGPHRSLLQRRPTKGSASGLHLPER